MTTMNSKTTIVLALLMLSGLLGCAHRRTEPVDYDPPRDPPVKPGPETPPAPPPSGTVDPAADNPYIVKPGCGHAATLWDVGQQQTWRFVGRPLTMPEVSRSQEWYR